MSRSVAERLQVVLPLIAGALILAGLLGPEQFAATGWGLGTICVIAAATIALRVRPRRSPEER